VLSGLAAQFSDESAFEVCIHVMRYTNRRPYFCFTFYVISALEWTLYQIIVVDMAI